MSRGKKWNRPHMSRGKKWNRPQIALFYFFVTKNLKFALYKYIIS
ncbi:MAG: hypothetical protein V8R51_03735 [Clostridia bacterium]